MRILILGAGKMGSFFTDILSFQHETAVFDVNPHQLRFGITRIVSPHWRKSKNSNPNWSSMPSP